LLAVLLKRQGAEVIAVSSAAEPLDVLVQSLTSNVPGQHATSTQHSVLSTQHFISYNLAHGARGRPVPACAGRCRLRSVR
jgi:hypothetical protein